MVMMCRAFGTIWSQFINVAWGEPAVTSSLNIFSFTTMARVGHPTKVSSTRHSMTDQHSYMRMYVPYMDISRQGVITHRYYSISMAHTHVGATGTHSTCYLATMSSIEYGGNGRWMGEPNNQFESIKIIPKFVTISH